jgi:hypothetical protein
VAERARIVLLAAVGQPDKKIAAALTMTPKKVSRWRKRFSPWGWRGWRKMRPGPAANPPSAPE